MIVYENPMSGNCWKVRQLLTMLGIEFERRQLDVIDRSARPELLGGLNLSLRIPTVVFDDGRGLGESDAILFHFAEGTEYLPSDSFERAQVLQWMFFEQYSHEPNIANARFWAIAGIEVSDAAREEKRVGGEKALQALEDGLTGREWLVGSAFSIADIALYAYTTSPPRAATTSSPTRRSALGSNASPPSPATSRSTASSRSRGPSLHSRCGYSTRKRSGTIFSVLRGGRSYLRSWRGGSSIFSWSTRS